MAGLSPSQIEPNPESKPHRCEVESSDSSTDNDSSDSDQSLLEDKQATRPLAPSYSDICSGQLVKRIASCEFSRLGKDIDFALWFSSTPPSEEVIKRYGKEHPKTVVGYYATTASSEAAREAEGYSEVSVLLTGENITPTNLIERALQSKGIKEYDLKAIKQDFDWWYAGELRKRYFMTKEYISSWGCMSDYGWRRRTDLVYNDWSTEECQKFLEEIGPFFYSFVVNDIEEHEVLVEIDISDEAPKKGYVELCGIEKGKVYHIYATTKHSSEIREVDDYCQIDKSFGIDSGPVETSTRRGWTAMQLILEGCISLNATDYRKLNSLAAAFNGVAEAQYQTRKKEQQELKGRKRKRDDDLDHDHSKRPI